MVCGLLSPPLGALAWWVGPPLGLVWAFHAAWLGAGSFAWAWLGVAAAGARRGDPRARNRVLRAWRAVLWVLGSWLPAQLLLAAAFQLLT